MYKKILMLFAGLLAFALPVAAEDAGVVPAHPVVWHVRGVRGQATLFGSLHVLPANMSWLTPDIVRGIGHSDVFVFEVPTDNESRAMLNDMITSHGRLPEGQSLRALLPPQSLSDYDAAIAAAHLSPDVTDHEQPWLVSLQLTLAENMNRSYLPDAGADYVLMSWARAHNRRVRYLETVDQQLQILVPGDDNLRLDKFETELKNAGQGQNSVDPLITAWSGGDVERLNTLLDSSFADRPEDRKRLLTDRNRNWARQIERMLGEGRNFFITVGAAHLTGPDGVPALLRADGYLVTGP